MKLYEAPSPNARRVRVFLAEKGIEVEGVGIDLRGAENRGNEFRAMNPFGRVPVLELDDGSFLTESVAISRYFEGVQPNPSLFGGSYHEQAVIEMWNRRAEINFMSAAAQAFRHLTGFFKDREAVSKEWGQISAEVAGSVLEIFDGHLATSDFLAPTFSVADITFGCALDFAEQVRLELPLDQPNLARYRARLAERASFQNN